MLYIVNTSNRNIYISVCINNVVLITAFNYATWCSETRCSAEADHSLRQTTLNNNNITIPPLWLKHASSKSYNFCSFFANENLNYEIGQK